ncbi:GlsB/YeaQ/YmgE family stress response membrane protein [Pseudooceanicola sp. CBS1P-1]|uniref:GlsB/YeaQ/YmgE family stress response membrane protein n=1 Tax=Pseudooceanicola albus TaxID=2692189 RepID=A0A6L7G703_9RHOB|nr:MULTISPECIES: GlsB/YeaQ/YmgE family stress response membrane protein [Pseudooceanicola]MBT9384182.1 GlsB/YeaQ/YmgE family stress response membrane protein [Pseudooceanicola endophyticus]MXN19719.1 GlsB/YeaQ/YmgE family stress response membrane protein [Pseudooceanicola albus]
MAGLGWIAAIIVGAIAGWIAEKIMSSSMGLILNIILGIVGAVVMNFLLLAIVGSTLGGWFGQLIVGVIGACLLIALTRALRRV